MPLTRRIAAFSAAILFASLFSARAESDLSGTAQEAVVSQYQDQTGQKVWTAEAKSRIPFLENWKLAFKAVGEWVQPAAGKETDTNYGDGSHHHDAARIIPGAYGMSSVQAVDGVSGASTRVTSDPGGHGRAEGAVSLQRALGNENPGFVGGLARYSGESDFHSLMAGLNGGVELFQRNTALSANLGAGLDIADPKEAPPGERDRWPTATTRFIAGIQAGQLLSGRTRIGASYSFTVILGPQENPYRRAVVHTTLFPEYLPQIRLRHVLGLELGTYLGRGVSVFHREGLYFDSWGVEALIPETAVPVEIGSRWMVTPRHRWYSQTAAPLYKVNYHVLTGDWMSGDPRLSRLEGNDYGLDVEYDLRPGDGAPSLSFSATLSDWFDLRPGELTRSWTLAISFRKPQ